MNTNRRAMLAAVAGVVAGFASVLALVQWRAARASEDELRLATEKYVTLQAQLREWETKARDVTRRAADAERDTAELLKAVESARLRSAANPGNASVTDSGVSAGTLMASATSGPAPTEEEQQRLAQERKFQQELAKVRAEQAKDRAAFESAAATAEPAKKFQLAMERVKWLADKAEFQAAIRTFNAAMAEKPAELPVSDDIRALQAMLQEQNTSIEVTLISDGLTFVSITNVRAPAKIQNSSVKLPSGDYEIVGRRPGYRDVLMLLKLRAGMPPQVVSVVCTRPRDP